MECTRTTRENLQVYFYWSFIFYVAYILIKEETDPIDLERFGNSDDKLTMFCKKRLIAIWLSRCSNLININLHVIVLRIVYTAFCRNLLMTENEII